MLAFSSWRNFFRKKKRAPEFTPPRPQRPGISRTPPPLNGRWVGAGGVLRFYFSSWRVAPKQMKGETPKQAEEGEKRERQKREKRKRNAKAPGASLENPRTPREKKNENTSRETREHLELLA